MMNRIIYIIIGAILISFLSTIAFNIVILDCQLTKASEFANKTNSKLTWNSSESKATISYKNGEKYEYIENSHTINIDKQGKVSHLIFAKAPVIKDGSLHIPVSNNIDRAIAVKSYIDSNISIVYFLYIVIIAISLAYFDNLLAKFIKNKKPIKSRIEIGLDGEAKVKYEIDEFIVYTLNDIMIQADNYTSQIDHIIITSRGIIVIETKNYKGKVKAEDKAFWIQEVEGRDYEFYNPVIQNHGHINALKNILNIESVNYYNLVVFAGEANLDIRRSALREREYVCYLKNMNKVIRKIITKGQRLLDEQEILAIYDTIKQKNITDSRQREEHIKMIQELKKFHKFKIVVNNRGQQFNNNIRKLVKENFKFSDDSKVWNKYIYMNGFYKDIYERNLREQLPDCFIHIDEV